MKISTKGRYGLMLMIDLALHASSGTPIALKSIAERQGLSDHYLEQLIAALRNAGLVRSIRGAYGGYMLGRSPAEITVADIILTLEGPLSLVDDEIDDGLAQLWRRMEDSLLSVMNVMTLQDLVEMHERGSGNYMYYI
ncbi:RrF2 family transcriptional regulator [Sulfoacidibacillus thermotolerans]|uniref:Transcriptional regulator n=1 Tax=Sulfoacidibacillus thermotolerans TaxID=1765684 RepID=A0A2U3D879_SULT2|nr:Rrf2 family transcriptional regulator [Sulfoacidibacillus thermotolerans]PWI57471.1 transcriptional regulator [Sulfoacidibacillus thermotolerans]